MARPRGRENARPSRKAIRSYYELLKSAANGGDTLAAAELIKINLMTNRKEAAHEAQL